MFTHGLVQRSAVMFYRYKKHAVARNLEILTFVT